MTEIEQLFMGHLRKMDRSDATILAYVSDVSVFSAWYREHCAEDMEPARVMSVDIREYKEHLLREGYKASSINRKLASLTAFFRFCVEVGILTSDPTSTIHGVRSQSAPAPRWLNRQEQKALIREVEAACQLAGTEAARFRSHRDRAMIALMLWGGLRRSEVADAEMARLEMNGKRGRLTVIGKGQKSRTVYLNADAYRAMRLWLKWRGISEGASGSRYIFLSQQGTGMTAKSVYRAVLKYAQKAGIHDMTPHSLRHTFGKALVDHGISLERIARLMGHESVTTTAIYLEPSQADLDQAVEAIAWTE